MPMTNNYYSTLTHVNHSEASKSEVLAPRRGTIEFIKSYAHGYTAISGIMMSAMIAN